MKLTPYRLLLTAYCLLLAVVFAGCISLPAAARAHRPAPLAASLEALYRYSPVALKPSDLSLEPRSGYELQRFKLSPNQEIPGFRPIRVDLYRPNRPGRLPVVLMSPILAGNNLYINEFAKFYAARGLAAVIVYRPREVFSADRELTDIENHFRESVIQLRQVIDWLQTLAWVDPERIGTFSISMGAILTTLLAAVEPRVKASVLALPAANVAEIIMTSKDKTIRKRRRAFLEHRGWSRAQGLAELRRVILSEPLAFAPAVAPKKTLMITGLFDRVLGLTNSLELWRVLGKPALVLLPTGHYTAYLATPYLKILSFSFLVRHLKPEGGPHG
ncbi:MAG: alpha/beta hydrolase [Candidatus Omnitrophica bacterium]|nr:alpha/beta hydrolase [Candidatus Omnitrophota bacterium]